MFTKLYNSTKCVDREVDLAVNVSQVRQLNPQRLVHRCEVQRGICMDSVLVQCVFGAR